MSDNPTKRLKSHKLEHIGSMIKPAVILGCHKLGLGVIRALGERRIPVIAGYYNRNDMGYVSKYVNRYFVCPNPEKQETEFIDVLMNMGKKEPGAVLFPTDDATLVAVSKHKLELEKYYKTTFENWENIKNIIDKKYSYCIAERAGVPSPKTILVTTISEAKKIIGSIGYPCLMKPSVGHLFYEIHRKKMLVLNNKNELEKAFRIASEYGANNEMLLQELIPGDDTHGYNYNSYYINGVPTIEFVAQKCRLSPPGIGFPRVIVSEYVPELIKLGRKMISAVGYNGYSCMEFKRDERNGKYVFMEINGRQNLSTSLAVKCGINFPYYTYIHASTGKLPYIKKEYKKGVYWIDLEKDVSELLKNFNKHGGKLFDYFLPYLKHKVFCMVSLKDPMPVLKRIKDGLDAILGKLITDNKSRKYSMGKQT